MSVKLIAEFQSVHEAETASSVLQQGGIAAFVSSKRSFRLPVNRGGASAVGLWVVLDTQHADAVHLLKNPNHKVEQRLSRAEMIEVQNSVHSADMTALLKFLFELLGIVALIALVVFAVTRT